MGNIFNKEWSTIENEEEVVKTKPKISKVIVADFDPRSPSSGIQRTPIFYVANDRHNASKNNILYNDGQRTPTLNAHKYDSISNQSFNVTADLSCSNISDLNYLLPDDESSLKGDQQALTDSASPDHDSKGSTKTLTNISSNLPRNILKRKQVEKINKKKFENLDSKENLE